MIVWDLDEAGATYHFEEHSDQVNDMAYSPDGTRLASASEDGTVKVWNAQTGALIETLTYPGPVYALDWSPDGEQIAYGGADLSGSPPEVVIVDAPQFDPITPPNFAEAAMEGLTSGQMGSSGPSVIDAGECPASLGVAFLNAPSAPVDTSWSGDQSNGV